MSFVIYSSVERPVVRIEMYFQWKVVWTPVEGWFPLSHLSYESHIVYVDSKRASRSRQTSECSIDDLFLTFMSLKKSTHKPSSQKP